MQIEAPFLLTLLRSFTSSGSNFFWGNEMRVALHHAEKAE